MSSCVINRQLKQKKTLSHKLSNDKYSFKLRPYLTLIAKTTTLTKAKFIKFAKKKNFNETARWKLKFYTLFSTLLSKTVSQFQNSGDVYYLKCRFEPLCKKNSFRM